MGLTGWAWSHPYLSTPAWIGTRLAAGLQPARDGAFVDTLEGGMSGVQVASDAV